MSDALDMGGALGTHQLSTRDAHPLCVIDSIRVVWFSLKSKTAEITGAPRRSLPLQHTNILGQGLSLLQLLALGQGLKYAPYVVKDPKNGLGNDALTHCPNLIEEPCLRWRLFVNLGATKRLPPNLCVRCPFVLLGPERSNIQPLDAISNVTQA